MRRTVLTAVAALLLVVLPAGANSRKANLTLIATVTGIPENTPDLTVWVPIPTSNRDQRISDVRIESDLKWEFGRDEEYGNTYVFARLDGDVPPDVEVRVHFTIERSTVLFDKLKAGNASQEELRRNLLADRLVTLSPRVRSIANDVTRNTRGILDEARALYDYVVRSLKVETERSGVETGDTERAIELHSGDSADFHSLFISLARARGIPARFVVGLRLPRNLEDVVTDLECWSEFYLQARGWIPVDTSTAATTDDPAVVNFLFGNLHFDRMQLSVGRDIVLDPAPAHPLNYFFYPYAEAEGNPTGTSALELRYSEGQTSGSKKQRSRE